MSQICDCLVFTMRRKLEEMTYILCFGISIFSWYTQAVMSNCEFPSYLPPGAVWTATYANKGYLTLYFKVNVIDAMYCPSLDQTCIKYERICLQEVEPGKYLVKHQPKGPDSTTSHAEYMCVQFIRRSDYIVQFKTSPVLSYQNSDFCSEEHLSLDHWPILSPSMMKTPPIKCPFTGGYNMRIHGPEGDLCPGKLVLPRMESECEDGDGISFDFRYDECLHPNLKMRKQQTVKCVTSWEYGKYTFVILRPDKADFDGWCMRISKKSNGEIEQIYLFMDLVCDPGTGNGHGQITETSNYLSITLEKITVPSVCANEFEGCNDRRFCKSEVVEYCHLSCNRCEQEVDLCTFPENIKGSWLLDTRDGSHYMNITSYQLFVPKFGRFQCLARNVSRNRGRTALLHVFDNGCFPRFACLEMSQPSTSVRQFRLSKRVKWPHWPIAEAQRVTCKDNNFRTTIEMGDTERKVNIPSQVLIEKEFHYSTECDIQDMGFQGNSMFFREGDKCNGCLIYDPDWRSDKIIIRTINCPKAAEYIEYICLTSLHLGENTKGVITGTQSTQAKILDNFLCWVFTKDGKKRKIIVLKAADCNSLTVEMVLEGFFQPAGLFDIVEFSPGTCPNSNPYQVVTPPTGSDDNLVILDSSSTTTRQPVKRPGVTKPQQSGPISYPGSAKSGASDVIIMLVSVLFTVMVR